MKSIDDNNFFINSLMLIIGKGCILYKTITGSNNNRKFHISMFKCNNNIQRKVSDRG